MSTNNFQRLGAASNAQVGSEFESHVHRYFASQGLSLIRNFTISVGVGGEKKPQRFDWGSQEPATLIECKSHAWTVTENIPSAKMTVWNEAMFYFYIAPQAYRKILFTLKSVRARDGMSLAAYYIKCHSHLIPDGVEIWEYDLVSMQAHRLL